MYSLTPGVRDTDLKLSLSPYSSSMQKFNVIEIPESQRFKMSQTENHDTLKSSERGLSFSFEILRGRKLQKIFEKELRLKSYFQGDLKQKMRGYLNST